MATKQNKKRLKFSRFQSPPILQIMLLQMHPCLNITIPYPIQPLHIIQLIYPKPLQILPYQIENTILTLFHLTIMKGEAKLKMMIKTKIWTIMDISTMIKTSTLWVMIMMKSQTINKVMQILLHQKKMPIKKYWKRVQKSG